jgi:(heptosyl)LPS beta-1,4-glucosyltransferase
MQVKSQKKISAAIIAHDEEKNLPGLLETLGFADEVVVLDAGSSDATAEAARTRAPECWKARTSAT